MKHYFLLMMIIAASCSSALKVTSDYDKNVSFGQYKTFSILATNDDSKTISQLNRNRFVNAVKAEMIKKGFTENTTSPDLLIDIATVVEDKKSVTANTNLYGYGGPFRPWGWGGVATGYTTYNVQHYQDGSLIIDIADSKTKNLIWEGIGNKQIDKQFKDPDKVIPEGVAATMVNFPPNNGK